MLTCYFKTNIRIFQSDDHVTGTIGAFSQELDSLTVSQLAVLVICGNNHSVNK